MEKMQNITRDVLAVIIITGTVVSLLMEFNAAGSELLRVMSGVILGYYYGTKTTPLAIGGKVFGRK